jgi:DNA-binding GntR family transcriptional regulator
MDLRFGRSTAVGRFADTAEVPKKLLGNSYTSILTLHKDCNIIAIMSQQSTSTLEPVTLADRAYQTLRGQILSGELAGGTRLRQHQLARTLGITTNPLREALVRLSRDGLVEMEPNMGARVREWRPEDYIQQFDVRIALESEFGMLAAQRSNRAELGELADRAWELDTLTLDPGADVMRPFELDIDIHRAIARAAKSSSLAEFWEVSIVQPKHNRPTPYFREHLEYCQPWSHSLLVRAIASRDPEIARRAVRRHICYSRAIDVRIMGLEWQFPQYAPDGVLVEVPEGTFTCAEDILRQPEALE